LGQGSQADEARRKPKIWVIRDATFGNIAREPGIEPC
jgi:hypothetical protein